MNNMRITLDELWLRMLEEYHYKDNDFIRERLDNLKRELPTGFDGWIKPWYSEHRFPQARFVFALCCIGMKIYKKGSNDFLNNSDETYKKIASNLEVFEVEKPHLADVLRQYGLPLPDFWFQNQHNINTSDERVEGILPLGETLGVDGAVSQDAPVVARKNAKMPKLSNKDMDKQDALAVAAGYWDVNPELRPKQVAEAILENRRVEWRCQPPEQKTLRDWLAPHAPKSAKKIGRPPGIPKQ